MWGGGAEQGSPPTALRRALPGPASVLALRGSSQPWGGRGMPRTTKEVLGLTRNSIELQGIIRSYYDYLGVTMIPRKFVKFWRGPPRTS